MSELHPGIQKVLNNFEKTLKEFGLSDFHTAGVEPARALLRSISPPVEFYPPIYRIENREIPGSSGNIPIRVYYPSEGKDFPALVWFHGGGWVIGDLETAEFNCRKMANDVECVVISIDYRLAPETPFPGAIDDCFVATEWIFDNGVDIGIDMTRIAVGGDSAGGNLAACVAIRARDKNIPLVFQLLIYPVTDADFNRPSYQEYAKGYFLTHDAMQWYMDYYVPDVNKRNHPDVTPIHAEDLSDLPPAFIITAEFDPLRDEGEAYGNALMEAGVDVEIKRYEGMIHGFFNMLTEEPIDEIILASSDAVNALQRYFK